MPKIQFKPGKHFGVKITNLENAISFYKTLGFELVERAENEAVIKCGDHLFSLDSSETGDVFFDFEVSDLNQAKEHLKNSKCKFLFEIPGKMLFVRDPYGMQFRLCETPP
jgi:catechol 2,3-dioxygenase-like lactoylglutathione lyase family enzyme